MSGEPLHTLLVEAPRWSELKRARAALASWRGRLDAADRAAFEAFAAETPELPDFLAAMFDGSPFLTDLSLRDPARLVRLLGAAPEASLAAALGSLPGAARGAEDEAAVMRSLRLARQEVALLLAIVDIGGVWPVMRVAEGLSDFADAATRLALDVALKAEAERGRLRPLDPEDPATASGYFILAMGKHGARELNFSSDIDLIVFYDRERVRLADPDEHQSVFVKVTQTVARLIGQKTYDGQVFRVDLRLRPDPGTYPLAIPTAVAENYYEAVGQNWERAAYIKARVVAGDAVAGERFLKDLRPFVWRKYLDYAALAEVHAMKRQIHAHKGHDDALSLPGHDLKLGVGGIREVEFFAQTQQLIGAGRRPSLRDPRTLAALDELAIAGWVAPRTRTELAEAYVLLRRLEHRLQMVADAQTHALPRDPQEFTAFARFAGHRSQADFERRLMKTLETVRGHYGRLFETADPTPSRLSFSGVEDDPETLKTLSALGYQDPPAAAALLRRWFAGAMPATRAAASRERLREILPRLLLALAGATPPDHALLAFDRFLARLPAGVQLFSLLAATPSLLDLFGDILGTAPRMGEVLARRPRVLEGLIEELHRPDDDPVSDVAARLAEAMAESTGFEDALDRARAFAQERMFLMGVRLLDGRLIPARAGQAHAALATAILRDLHQRVSDEYAIRHGRTPKNASVVIGLGKLGTEEMGATSDLDLILLYDDESDAESDGPKPQYASEYYTKLTQRLVAALSAPTAEGKIYDVDFRLRPSGNKGPLATSFASFLAYQRQEAWTWEHMALTRARVVSGPRDFAMRVDAGIREVLTTPRDLGKLSKDLAEMRRMLSEEKPPTTVFDIKRWPGGQVDVEFMAQWLILAHGPKHPDLLRRAPQAVFRAAREHKLVSDRVARDLLSAARLYEAVTQILRLAWEGPFDPALAPRGLSELLARATGVGHVGELEAELIRAAERVKAIAGKAWGAEPWGR